MSSWKDIFHSQRGCGPHCSRWRDGIGLLGLLTLDRLPLVEAIDRQDATPPPIGLFLNIGEVRTVSHLALIGLRPPVGSLHQCGIKPQRSGSSDTTPVSWLRRITSRSWLGAGRIVVRALRHRRGHGYARQPGSNHSAAIARRALSLRFRRAGIANNRTRKSQACPSDSIWRTRSMVPWQYGHSRVVKCRGVRAIWAS